MSVVHLPVAAILSPCVGVCELDERGLCQGCWRTGDEIAAWAAMSPAQRQYLMDNILPEREAGYG